MIKRAFPAHPHRKRGRFAHREIGRETRPALGRPEGEMMLDPVALEGLGRPVVHVHRQGHGHGALREHEPVAVVLVDVQVFGDDPKLFAGHPKNFVVVDVHRRRAGKV